HTLHVEKSTLAAHTTNLGFEIDVKLRKMYGKILAQILCTGTLLHGGS
ncbi:hypothetical protein F444_10385, partial [Phytophthora nicotianae P1976]